MPASKGIGRLIQFGLAKETVRGTPNASATYWLPWADHSIDEKDARIPVDTASGVIEEGNTEVVAKQWSEATIKAPVDDTIHPLFLLSLLGTDTVTGPTDTAAYTHPFTVAQTPIHQALSFYSNDDLSTVDYKYGLGVVDSYDIDITPGKFVEFSLKMKGKKGTSTTNTPATTAINRFRGDHLTSKYAATFAGLGAGTAFTCRNVKISIKNNIEDDFNLGSLAPTDFVNKSFKVTGTFDLLWVDETYKTLATAGTKTALRFDLINTDAFITGCASTYPELKIDLANCVLGQPSRAIKLNDMVIQTIPFTAYYSTTDSLMLKITAVNGVASY